jgi:hypothetical protein
VQFANVVQIQVGEEMQIKTMIAILMVITLPALAHHTTETMTCYSEYSNGCDITVTPTHPLGQEEYWWTEDPGNYGIWSDFVTDVYWNRYSCFFNSNGQSVDLWSEVVGYEDTEAHLCYDCWYEGGP